LNLSLGWVFLNRGSNGRVSKSGRGSLRILHKTSQWKGQKKQVVGKIRRLPLIVNMGFNLISWEHILFFFYKMTICFWTRIHLYWFLLDNINIVLFSGNNYILILKAKIFGYEDGSYKSNVLEYFLGVIFHIVLIIKVMKNGATRREYI
jgi:hypothetical protein